jgi:predicted amidophosphoribosyltransferase
MGDIRSRLIDNYCLTCSKPEESRGCGMTFRSILEPIRCPTELARTHSICPFCLELYNNSQRHTDFCLFARQNLTLTAGGWVTPTSYQVRRAIRQAAFPFQQPVTNLLRILLTEIGAQESVIVPMPMSNAGRQGRWAQMARAAAHGIPGASVLPLIQRYKQKSTRKSVAQERARIAQEEYRVIEGTDSQIQGRRVILLDDNVTSGATMTSCAAMLKRLSPAAITPLSIDRALSARALQRCPEPKNIECSFHVPGNSVLR